MSTEDVTQLISTVQKLVGAVDPKKPEGALKAFKEAEKKVEAFVEGGGQFTHSQYKELMDSLNPSTITAAGQVGYEELAKIQNSVMAALGNLIQQQASLSPHRIKREGDKGDVR